MNINTGFNPYNSNYVNNADLTKMSQSQSLTSSPTESLKEGEIFEGSVNSIENGKVTIGLANGQTMTARLDGGVSLTEGQSVFFQVKSNDGSLIQIRPVSLGSLDANPTLLKALDMANIAATERTINMVNSMMQNSLSISLESLANMNRAMLNNPSVDPQTLVTMAKYGMEMSPENVSMFQNYANDKAVSLTKHEYNLVRLLMRYPEKIYSKQELYELAWDEYYVGEDKTVNVHISNIRKKLFELTGKEYIDTVWGIGIRLKKRKVMNSGKA